MTPREHLSVVPAEFPELRALVWNRDPARPIPAEEAFALYERNWRHVDTANMTPRERDLIRELADRFGGGILLVS